MRRVDVSEWIFFTWRDLNPVIPVRSDLLDSISRQKRRDLEGIGPDARNAVVLGQHAALVHLCLQLQNLVQANNNRSLQSHGERFGADMFRSYMAVVPYQGARLSKVASINFQGSTSFMRSTTWKVFD